MVFVKVRETYDLCTVKNKMTVIGIHTPKPNIIKKNFPGLLMQCKAYRPVSCDVRVACASMLPLDPTGVGTSEGEIAPEDVFNPILYKAITNVGMSQLEARITAMSVDSQFSGQDIVGDSAMVDADTVSSYVDEFPIYYGLLSNAHGWKHANPQSGLQMTNLKPLVYELLYNVGDNIDPATTGAEEDFNAPNAQGVLTKCQGNGIRGNAKPLPFINCTAYTYRESSGTAVDGTQCESGFDGNYIPNAEQTIPYINCMCAVIIVPPSKLHQLFYRMVVEWTIEFSSIRPIGEITNFWGLSNVGSATHYQNYSYSSAKGLLTGDEESILDNDTCMVSANVDVDKVM